MAKAGRRPGRSESRERILAAARDLFAQHGYEGTTVRAIAAKAGVTPALLHHFFGSKDGVFVAALNLPFDPATMVSAIVNGPREQLGQRMVRFMLEVWSQPESRQSFFALLRSVSTHDDAVQMFRQFVESTVLDRVAEELETPKVRLTAAAAQIVGLALMRHVIGIEPLANATEDEIVGLVAPVIQHYVDGTMP